jgi:hypothetical protein
MSWVDGTLPIGAKLITVDWLALSPRSAISDEWQLYTSSIDSERGIYENIVKEKNPDFRLIITPVETEILNPICMNLLYAGPFEYKESTRNPFNSGRIKKAWLVHFNYDFSTCLPSSSKFK